MMERKFYTDNLEKLLKENADQFKMYPSKKVWHGLYNDLHPGRRWPSITMSIFFLFSLVIIGHLNTSTNHVRPILGNVRKSIQFSPQPVHKSHSRIIESTDDAIVQNGNAINVSPDLTSDALALPNSFESLTTIPKTSNLESAYSGTSHSNLSSDNNSDEAPNSKEILTQKHRPLVKLNQPVAAIPFHQTLSSTDINKVNATEKNPNKLDEKVSSKGTGLSPEIMTQEVNPASYVNDPLITIHILSQTVKSDAVTASKSNKKDVVKTQSSGNSSSLLTKLKKENLSWSFYLSPSISFRILGAPHVNNKVPISVPLLINQPDPKYSAEYMSLGGEAGAMANYVLSKKFQFQTGIQLNYSQFNIAANHTHPAIATLYLNSESTGSPYTLTAISFYGNGTSTSESAEATLHNYSFQVSLPVGFQYKISGNDKIQLHLAATFQPSYVIANQSYLLSSDRRNYFTDPDLLRKWNMNTSFGTYVSFKTNKLHWQIGPQIRYQVLSTYSQDYPSNEHLVDYGIRFGLIKNITR